MEIIVTLTPEAAPDPLAAIGRPPEGAALVELRLDLFPGIDVPAAVAACPLPVLATLRSAAEGGRGPDESGARLPLLAAARDAGAALIDLELDRDLEALRSLGIAPEQTVLSWHDPAGTPRNLDRIANVMLATPAAFLKLVPTAERLADLAAVLGLYQRARPERRRLIAFAMGPVGVPTRLLAPLLGAPVAFAAWSAGAAAAPGQPTVGRLRAITGHLNGPPQRLFGVVRAEATASLSPVMHGAGFAALGLPYLMVPVGVPDPAELELVFRPAGETLFDRVGLPVGGWAVSTPYKDRAAAAATVAAPRVKRSGSANTLVLRPAAVLADTTDPDGVVGALTAAGVEIAGRTAVVQGTGGAGRAVAVGLDLAGANVRLRGRDDGRTRQVAGTIGVRWLAPDEAPPAGAILVNATPLGSSEDDLLPFTEAEVAGSTAVVDMVYGSRPPALAAIAGARYVDGRSVLARQGFAQFAAFTGQLPPKDAMLASIRSTD
jgi:3-dehydroquinate dehydratase/shikimate dehydrogenase